MTGRESREDGWFALLFAFAVLASFAFLSFIGYLAYLLVMHFTHGSAS